MARNRKAAEAVVLKWIAEIDTSGMNTKLLKEQFHAMNDREFFDWVEECRAKKDFVPIVMPNLSSHGITIKNNLEVAKRMGVEFFQRLWITDETTGRRFLSVEKYLGIWVSVKRQIQTLVDGFTVPDHNRSVDDLTNQPVGDSKGSGVSGPEILILAASELDNTILECIKVRGGDEAAMRLADQSIIETGHCSIDSTMKLGTRAKATDTMSKLLTSAHFKNTF